MNGAKKTHIVYSANLKFEVMKKYIKKFTGYGFLRSSSDARLFTTTRKGIEFLRRYKELKTLL